MISSNPFDRATLIKRLQQQSIWDIIIIGGGATGLGTAVDAASRGYATLLLEQHDFAKGTSSRSTKLVHGGVRYLAQGDLRLVYTALRERNILTRNASHVVKSQSFVIPCYTYWHLMKYGAGLRIYDLLAGRFGLARSRMLSRKQVVHALPGIKQNGLKGGIEYYDGQFDDARLAINLAQTAIEKSAVVLNYITVKGLMKSGGRVAGVTAIDNETGEGYSLHARTVINATGVFADEIIKMDQPSAATLIQPSQGVHVVVQKKFLKGASALMIPQTSDGRVLFAVPWHDHLVVGTTDTPLDKNALEPVATKSDVNFILDNLRQYLPAAPAHADILSTFAGLRPLAAAIDKGDKIETKELSRDHKLIVSKTGLVTITGGKWTTYRKMAEDAVDTAAAKGGLTPSPCVTEHIALHGNAIASDQRLSIYGSDSTAVRGLMQMNSRYAGILVAGHPYTIAEVVWAIRYEMARTIEDVLARRLRLLFLDARAAIEAAPVVGDILAEELQLGGDIIAVQLTDFNKIAANYILNT